MIKIHYINVRMQNISKVDEEKVNWDENIYQFIIRSVIKKNDIKHEI